MFELDDLSGRCIPEYTRPGVPSVTRDDPKNYLNYLNGLCLQRPNNAFASQSLLFSNPILGFFGCL